MTLLELYKANNGDKKLGNRMKFCNREVVPYWWCIDDECKHCARKVGYRNRVENNLCVHPDIIEQMDPTQLRVMGYPVKDMLMCPVLTNVQI